LASIEVKNGGLTINGRKIAWISLILKILTVKYNSSEFKTFIRFGLSGVFVTLFAYALYLGSFSLTANDFASVVFSYILGIPVSFHLNCKFVFNKSYTVRSFTLFSSVQLGAMLLNYAILHSLNLYCPRYISAVISYGIVPVIVFTLSRLVIFRK